MPQYALQGNSFQHEEYILRVLTDTDNEVNTLSSFDCGDLDLNDFFRSDCLPHRNQLMVETYVFTEQGSIVALISFCNDSLELTESVRRDLLPPPMINYRSIPAVKIARFGVLSGNQGRGIGTLIIKFCKKLFVTDNRTGCRLITVDAYNKDRVIKFYTSFIWIMALIL